MMNGRYLFISIYFPECETEVLVVLDKPVNVTQVKVITCNSIQKNKVKHEVKVKFVYDLIWQSPYYCHYNLLGPIGS